MQGDGEDTAVGGEDAGHSEDEEALSQGTVSLLDISASDNEEARKAAACETAHRSDVQYGTWWDEQIHQGNEGITRCNKQVNDYADSGRPSKAPDKIGALLYYMEERGVFKPLDTIANPLGLWRFYRTDPQKSNVITGPKSAASVRRIKCLLELAKELGWPLTIMVFEGGMVTPLGLLQELHLHLTVMHTDPHSGGEDGTEKQCPAAPYARMSSKMITHSSITSSSATTGAAFPVGNAWSLRHPPGSR